MKQSHLQSAPDSKYIGKTKIEIAKLDSLFDNIYEPEDSILLKIDTQGYEKFVLLGAEKSISKIKGIQLEMSLTPLYEGELTYLEMINHLNSLGFSLYSLEFGFSDPQSGQLLQVDGIFFKD
jgi:hypothetical protein